MNLQCKLIILILVLTLDDQVDTGKIVGGHEALPHSRPYMVLLERKMHTGDRKYCGGFLLNEDFVMTAAHCQAKSYRFLLGVHKIHQSDHMQNISEEQAFPHKDYKQDGFKNDIMLLKMSSKAHFNNNVGSIALATQGDDSLPQSCTVSGWGTTGGNTKHMSLTLMEANVTLIGSEQCANEKSYCSQGDIGPDVGDSGGPLVCEDGKVYGVVSSIFKPHTGGPPIHHYVKIADYRSWIDSIMKE